MYCAANTYFCLVCVRISLFVRVPFSPFFLYVNLRIPICLYVNLRGFGIRTRIRSFVRVPFFPVCLSVNICGFVPRFSVRMSLSSVCRGLPLYLNTLLQWDDEYQVCPAIVLVNSKAATTY